MLQACLNGGRSREEHPAVPLSAAQLAADAHRCVEAGASSVHVHPRLPDGEETLAPPVVAVGSSADVERAVALPCRRLLVEPDDVEGAVAIEEALAEAEVEAPQLHHGTGQATWAVLERAVARGHDIRVGLEDTVELPDGRRARDNAELLAAAARLLTAVSETSQTRLRGGD